MNGSKMRILVLLFYFVCVHFSAYTFDSMCFTWRICIQDTKFKFYNHISCNSACFSCSFIGILLISS